MTAIYKSLSYRNEARLKYGIDDYLIKPFSCDDLKRVFGEGAGTSGNVVLA